MFTANFKTTKLPFEFGGNCGKSPLDFFPNDTYSRKLCTVNYKFATAADACSCLAPNMPQTNGNFLTGSWRLAAHVCLSRLSGGRFVRTHCRRGCPSLECRELHSWAPLRHWTGTQCGGPRWTPADPPSNLNPVKHTRAGSRTSISPESLV